MNTIKQQENMNDSIERAETLLTMQNKKYDDISAKIANVEDKKDKILIWLMNEVYDKENYSVQPDDDYYIRDISQILKINSFDDVKKEKIGNKIRDWYTLNDKWYELVGVLEGLSNIIIFLRGSILESINELRQFEDKNGISVYL